MHRNCKAVLFPVSSSMTLHTLLPLTQLAPVPVVWSNGPKLACCAAPHLFGTCCDLAAAPTTSVHLSLSICKGVPSQDPIGSGKAPQSIRVSLVSRAVFANVFVSVCIAVANSLHAVCDCLSFVVARFLCFSGHCETQCRPLQMTPIRSCCLSV